LKTVHLNSKFKNGNTIQTIDICNYHYDMLRSTQSYEYNCDHTSYNMKCGYLPSEHTLVSISNTHSSHRRERISDEDYTPSVVITDIEPMFSLKHTSTFKKYPSIKYLCQMNTDHSHRDDFHIVKHRPDSLLVPNLGPILITITMMRKSPLDGTSLPLDRRTIDMDILLLPNGKPTKLPPRYVPNAPASPPDPIPQNDPTEFNLHHEPLQPREYMPHSTTSANPVPMTSSYNEPPPYVSFTSTPVYPVDESYVNHTLTSRLVPIQLTEMDFSRLSARFEPRPTLPRATVIHTVQSPYTPNPCPRFQPVPQPYYYYG
jgi:hypothetical protein